MLVKEDIIIVLSMVFLLKPSEAEVYMMGKGSIGLRRSNDGYVIIR